MALAVQGRVPWWVWAWLPGGGALIGRSLAWGGALAARGRGMEGAGSWLTRAGRRRERAEEPAGGDQTDLSGGRSCSRTAAGGSGPRAGNLAGRAGAAPRPGRLRPGEAPCARRDQQHEQRLQQPRGGRGGLFLHRQDLLL